MKKYKLLILMLGIAFALDGYAQNIKITQIVGLSDSLLKINQRLGDSDSVVARGDTVDTYIDDLTTPVTEVVGKKNVDTLFLNQARFKDNVDMDSTLNLDNGITLGAGDTKFYPLDSSEVKGLVNDSLDYLIAADTVALKLKQGIDGKSVYLEAINTTAKTGGGWFVLIDSTYSEGGAAFDSPITGKQWARVELSYSKEVIPQWFGATGDISQDATSYFIKMKTFAFTESRNMYIPAGYYRISGGIGANKLNFTGAAKIYGRGFDKNPDGRFVTRLYPAADGDTLLYCGGLTSQARTMQFSDLVLVGVNGTDTAKVGVKTYSENYFNNIEFIYFSKSDTAIAVLCQGDDAVFFDKCLWYLNDISVQIEADGANTPNDVGISNSRIIWSKYYGVHASNLLLLNIENTSLESASMGYSGTISVNTTTNYLTVDNAFLYRDGDSVEVSTTGSLPSPLADSTTYYIVNRDGLTLQLSATRGGAAIDLTTAGSGSRLIAINKANNEIWLSYCKSVNINGCYFELSEDADSRFLYVAPYTIAGTAYLSNINVYGITQTANTAEYAFELSSHAGTTLQIFGGKMQAGVAPGLVTDTLIYSVDIYGLLYDQGSFGNSTNRYTIHRYCTSKFTHTVGNGLFNLKPDQYWGESDYTTDVSSGVRNLKTELGTNYIPPNGSSNPYIYGTIMGKPLTPIHSLSAGDTIKITINFANQQIYMTDGMYCKLRIAYASYQNIYAGEHLILEISQLKNGGAPLSGTTKSFSIDTLSITAANSGWYPLSDIIDSVRTDSSVIIYLIPNSSLSANAAYFSGEVMYGGNIRTVEAIKQ